MNRLYNPQKDGYPLVFKDFEFIQNAINIAIAGMLSNYTSQSFIISGCTITESTNTFNVSNGYLVLNGEVCQVKEHSVQKLGIVTDYVFKLKETDHPDGMKQFEDDTLISCYKQREACLIREPVPSGVFIKPTDKTYNQLLLDYIVGSGKMALSNHSHSDLYYTNSEVNTKLNTKADVTHIHDDRYYTESEVNNKLNEKANNVHTHDDRYYTESETDNKLNGKANITHSHDERYYTESETDNKLALKVDNSVILAHSTVNFVAQELLIFDYDISPQFDVTINDIPNWANAVYAKILMNGTTTMTFEGKNQTALQLDLNSSNGLGNQYYYVLIPIADNKRIFANYNAGGISLMRVYILGYL